MIVFLRWYIFAARWQTGHVDYKLTKQFNLKDAKEHFKDELEFHGCDTSSFYLRPIEWWRIPRKYRKVGLMLSHGETIRGFKRLYKFK